MQICILQIKYDIFESETYRQIEKTVLGYLSVVFYKLKFLSLLLCGFVTQNFAVNRAS